MMVTLQEISNELHISKSLVSKIANNRYVRVSDDVRVKVLEKIREYNYVPNRAATALNSKKMYLIACIVTNLSYHYFPELVSYIEQYAFSLGYNVVLCNVAEDVKREKKYLEMYSSGLFDGILATSSDGISNTELYKRIHDEDFPIVFVDRYVPNIGISFVTTDNRAGANILTRKLIQSGHKKICFLGYKFANHTVVQGERFSGYEQAMLEENFIPRMVYMDGDSSENLQMIFNAPDERPTAIVMISSWQIQGVLHLCRKYMLRIPRDFEIATFDDFQLPFNTAEEIQNAKMLDSPMLILRQDVKAVAAAALEVLLREIDGDRQNVQKIIQPLLDW
ncbi:MAG: LacI family transcriptional regulator [Synergistaceae bacterium]|jgi:DNA-binding LacI/PurR family transcriptional regulator|nr:LacI family transcriptional regulator [Synergistaceae bacterium]